MKVPYFSFCDILVFFIKRIHINFKFEHGSYLSKMPMIMLLHVFCEAVYKLEAQFFLPQGMLSFFIWQSAPPMFFNALLQPEILKA